MLYCRSYGGAQMLVSEGGAGETLARPDNEQGEIAVDDVLRVGAQVAERFPAYAEAGLASSWTGVYDVTPDWNPVLGPPSRRPGARRRLRIFRARLQALAGGRPRARAGGARPADRRFARAVRARALSQRQAIARTLRLRRRFLRRRRRDSRRRAGPARPPRAPARPTLHRSITNGQRGWKWQPDGGSTGDGGSPSCRSSATACSGSGIGDDDLSSRV